MYSQIAVCLVLVAGIYAHGNNGYSGYNGYMGGNGGMGGNGMGTLLSQILSMHNQQPRNQQGSGQMGGQGGLGGPFAYMLIQTLMDKMGNDGNKGDNGDRRGDKDMIDEDEWKRYKAMAKMEDAMNLAKFVTVYQEYEKKMESFKKSVEYLCLGVAASYEYGRKNNMTVNDTLQARVDALGKSVEKMDNKEKIVEALVVAIGTDKEAFQLGFFQIAHSVCEYGSDYEEAHERLEMMKGKHMDDSSESEPSSESEGDRN